MKKNTLYLIGAVAGALLLLLAVPSVLCSSPCRKELPAVSSPMRQVWEAHRSLPLPLRPRSRHVRVLLP